MPDSNLSQTLLTAAEAYIALSYSVIPVWGVADPTRPKVAGVEWVQYQRRRPTPSEIHHWFSNDRFGGIAIVTGSISRLVVLDFDTQEHFQQFRTQHPDLAANHIIQTRRGFHIYFHLSPHLHLPSRKGQGIDLLSDGRYVIARPTCIDGHTYKLIRGGQPKTLTQFDVHRITRFLDELGGSVAPNTAKREFTPFSFDSEPLQNNHRELQKSIITASDLKTLYHGLLAKGFGRNDSLFQVSLKARDTGWTVEQTAASLTDLHVWQAASNHGHETPTQRYIEARKTVQSAFSRPARQPKRSEQDKYGQIPNSVREHLFKLGQTRTVRVLDGLRLQGITPGMVFTTNQALELLKGIVGRDSVYAALQSTTASGHQVFEHQNPSPAPPTPANAATRRQSKSNKCFIGREEKSGISPNHRPATVYIMPSNNELCDCLGVKRSRSDLLTLDDLATAKQTRMALHREFIRRRPGRYPRRWLARRLGVSCETLDVYNRETEGLHFRPCFWEQSIFWSNLNAVPDGIEIAGAFLQDETGHRYPANRKIAAILLGQGRKMVYKRQDANYYWYSKEPIQPSQEPTYQPTRSEIQVQEPVIRYYVPLKASDTAVPTNRLSGIAPIPPVQPRRTPSNIGREDDGDRKLLPDKNQEAIALRVYNILNTGVTDSKHAISQKTCRRLVQTYGSKAIEDALQLMAKRQHIRQPVSFLVSVLRSESKRYRQD